MHDRTSAASPLPPAPRPAETPAQEKMGVWAVRGSLCVCLMVLPYISYPTASPWSRLAVKPINLKMGRLSNDWFVCGKICLHTSWSFPNPAPYAHGD